MTRLLEFRLRMPILVPAMILSPVICWAQVSKVDADESTNLVQIDMNYSEQVIASEKPAAELKEKFKAALEKYQEEAQKAGNLDGMLAAKSELANLDAGKAVVAKSADAGLLKLQTAYVGQWQTVEANRQRDQLAANKARLDAFDSLVSELTKAGKIDEAVRVKEEAKKVPAVTPRAGKDKKPETQVAAGDALNPGKIGMELRPRDVKLRTNQKGQDERPGFWIGRGKSFLDLGFAPDRIALGRASKSTLVFRVGQTPYSGTPAKIEISCDDKVIGSRDGAKRGQIVKIPLDLAALRSAKTFKLTITVHGENMEITKTGEAPDVIILLE